MSNTNEQYQKDVVRVEAMLDAFFIEQKTNAQALDPSYARLWSVLHSVFQGGGKRLRPTMMLMSYGAFTNKSDDLILPVAAALELLHMSLLVHDDIIDRQTVRHGALNVSGHHNQAYASYLDDAADRQHYADSAALIGGDLLLAAVYKIILGSDMTDAYKVQALRLLEESIFTVAAGQLLDTEATFKDSDDIEPLTIANLKTAGYSFIGPLTIGGTLAGATRSQLIGLRAFGADLGVAFQLTDDLLGVFGDSSKTGKSTKTDLVESKETYLVQQCRKLLLHTHERDHFNELFKKKAKTSDDITELKNILESSGARAVCQKEVAVRIARAQKHLDKLALAAPDHEAFMALISLVTNRKK